MPQCNTFGVSGPARPLLDLVCFHPLGGTDVDHALRLDVLVVCVVFAFVGAILLGVF